MSLCMGVLAIRVLSSLAVFNVLYVYNLRHEKNEK